MTYTQAVLERLSCRSIAILYVVLSQAARCQLTSFIQSLEFYGLLRRFSSLEFVEVDVSEWKPPPRIPAGVRALLQVIFVNDFEGKVIAASHGT